MASWCRGFKGNRSDKGDWLITTVELGSWADSEGLSVKDKVVSYNGKRLDVSDKNNYASFKEALQIRPLQLTIDVLNPRCVALKRLVAEWEKKDSSLTSALDLCNEDAGGGITGYPASNRISDLVTRARNSHNLPESEIDECFRQLTEAKTNWNDTLSEASTDLRARE